MLLNNHTLTFYQLSGSTFGLLVRQCIDRPSSRRETLSPSIL